MESAEETMVGPELVQAAQNMTEPEFRRHLVARHGAARITREEHDRGHARHPDALHQHEQIPELE